MCYTLCHQSLLTTLCASLNDQDIQEAIILWCIVSSGYQEAIVMVYYINEY